MKQILLIVLLTAAAFTAVAQTPAKAKSGADAKAEQEIKQKAAEYEKAMRQRDADALAPLLADELIVSEGNGNTYGKAQLLQGLKANTNQSQYDDYHFEEMTTNVYRDSAVVNLVVVMKGRSKNGEFNGRMRSTSMVVKQKGQWKVVAFHNSTPKQQ